MSERRDLTRFRPKHRWKGYTSKVRYKRNHGKRLHMVFKETRRARERRACLWTNA